MMRGLDQRTGELFWYVNSEARVRCDHSLNAIHTTVHDALAALGGKFAPFYVRI